MKKTSSTSKTSPKHIATWIVVILIILFVINAVFSFFYLIPLWKMPFTLLPTCDTAGGWGRGAFQSCDCQGVEVTLFNHLAFDGDYVSVCVGKPTITEYRSAEENERRFKCGLEGLQCSDGSWVYKTGENCGYKACPDGTVFQSIAASPTPQSSPMFVPVASPSVKPTPKTSLKPSPKPSSSPSPATTFDLNLDEVILSTAPTPAELSWGGVINAKSSGEFTLEKRQRPYAVTVSVRNNGHEPALNVTYEVIVDGKSTKVIKDRIDQGTAHREWVTELPDDDKRHDVRVNISVDMLESNRNNNSHAFSYQIK